MNDFDKAFTALRLILSGTHTQPLNDAPNGNGVTDTGAIPPQIVDGPQGPVPYASTTGGQTYTGPARSPVGAQTAPDPRAQALSMLLQLPLAATANPQPAAGQHQSAGNFNAAALNYTNGARGTGQPTLQLLPVQHVQPELAVR